MALQKNILEHISLMAQEQVQLEFVKNTRITTIQQQLAPMMQNPQAMMQKSKSNAVQQRVQQITSLMKQEKLSYCRNDRRLCKEEEKIYA